MFLRDLLKSIGLATMKTISSYRCHKIVIMNSQTAKSFSRNVKPECKKFVRLTMQPGDANDKIVKLPQKTALQGQLKRCFKLRPVRSLDTEKIRISLADHQHRLCNDSTDTTKISDSKNSDSGESEYEEVQYIEEDDPAFQQYLLSEMDCARTSDSNLQAPSPDGNEIDIVKQEIKTEPSESEFTQQNSDFDDCDEEHDPKLCCSSCRNLNIMCLEKLNEIMQYLKSMKHTNEHSQPVTDNDQEAKYNLLPEFPLNTVEQILDFDAQLSQHAVRKQFEKKVATIGGIKLQKSVAAMMTFFMTNEISKSFSWTGVGQTIQISNATAIKIIVEILQGRHPGTLIKEVQDKIAEWLRRCGDRIRASEKAKERKLQMQHPQVERRSFNMQI